MYHVDEQLAGYRGRIPGRTYIPSKARKYGLKLFWTCESNTGYALNAIAYAGKEGNCFHYNLAQDIVLKVVEPWYGTGRDICTNNYFTSYTLANRLLQQNLKLLGTVCRLVGTFYWFCDKKTCTGANLFLIMKMEYVWWPTKPKERKTHSSESKNCR